MVCACEPNKLKSLRGFSNFKKRPAGTLSAKKIFKMEYYIKIEHIAMMNIVIMGTGSIVGVAYITELFLTWCSGVDYEPYTFLNRATGPYW